MNVEEVKGKIESKGYWRVVIRPSKTDFKSGRLQIDDLQKVVEAAQVRLRGWYYPHIDGNNVVRSDRNKIRNFCDWEDMSEFWEFTTSGQFGHIFSMREDYLIPPDSEIARRIRSRQHFEKEEAQKINKFLESVFIIHRLTEIYQFAANLAQHDSFNDVKTFEISIDLFGVKDRMLYIGDPNRGDFLSPYICRFDSDKISHDKTYNTEDLIGQFDSYALEVILDIYKSFNWMRAEERVIREDQKKLLERRV